MSTQSISRSPGRLIPLSKWNDYHEWPTVAAIRQYRFFNRDNFNRCVKKLGRRVLIDEADFFDWFNSQQK